MSKIATWTEEEVKSQRPDIDYTIVDMLETHGAQMNTLLLKCEECIEKGIVTAFPYTRFETSNIRDAFRYMAKVRHIGKVIVGMPEPVEAASSHGATLHTPLFSNRSSYLVTGGLGGVGMQVCKYLVDQGARHIVLVGRQPPNKSTAAEIDQLRADATVNIVVFQANVGSWDECSKLLDKMKDPSWALPPLRGIMHCAGTLSDGLIEKISWKHFQSTYESKVKGTWNLHKLTLDYHLEHFVLFSSVTAPIGAAGQASHVSACAFEDTFAVYRNSLGLPATTINWGHWGQIGIAAEAEAPFIRPFSPLQAINALDYILRRNKNYTIVATWSPSLPTSLPALPYTRAVMDAQLLAWISQGDGQVASSSSTMGESVAQSAQFWQEYASLAGDTTGQVDLVKKLCAKILVHVLRRQAGEGLEDDVELPDLGLDSLMMLEVRNYLEHILGEKVEVNSSMLQDATLLVLSSRIQNAIEAGTNSFSSAPPSLEETANLINQDINLPAHITAPFPGSEVMPSKIKTILLTGATGLLGTHFLAHFLTNYPQLKKIYCLVRVRKGISPWQRLTSSLRAKGLSPDDLPNFDNVVVPLAGCVTNDMFGLSQEVYNKLECEVEAVVHCAANVNHTEHYKIVEEGKHDLRTVNVLGLLRILEFCCSGQATKHLLHSSTILCVSESGENSGKMPESWPTPGSKQITHSRGYILSKYVGEILVGKAARERNIPCKALRYAEIRSSGLNEDGPSAVESSHAMRVLLFFLREGFIPDLPVALNFLPVDVAATLSARILFHDTAPNQIYNVVHPQPQFLHDYLPQLGEELGRPLPDRLSFDDARQRIANSNPKNSEAFAQKDGLVAEFQNLYQDRDALFSYAFPIQNGEGLVDGENAWKSERLSELIPDVYTESRIDSTYEIIKRDLRKAQREGLFTKFGIEP